MFHDTTAELVVIEEEDTAEIIGAVASALLTLTMTDVAVAKLLAASLATAVNVWAPFAVVAVSHKIE